MTGVFMVLKLVVIIPPIMVQKEDPSDDEVSLILIGVGIFVGIYRFILMKGRG